MLTFRRLAGAAAIAARFVAVPSVTAAFALAALVASPHAQAQAAFPDHYVGDLGGAAYLKSGVVKGDATSTLVLPYVYGDYGRFFGRIDTFGVKTLAIGWGHLELVGRVNTEGFRTDTAALRGLSDRRNPVPLGIGTFQRTPIGGVFLYAMHDVTSGGMLAEATWGTKFETAWATFYPLISLEYRSSAYVNYLYGVTPGESAASGYAAYNPGASVVPLVGLAASIPIAGDWALQLQFRHRWFDSAITNSPIVSARTQQTGNIAITYEFK
jgi:outer membrane protein